jgi:CBS domain-containing protein
MKASEVMVTDPIVAVANASATEVAIMFRNRNISVVPVVDDHRTRRLLGVVSDRDLVTRVLAPHADPDAIRADEIMRTDSCTVSPDTELDGFELPLNQDPSDSHLRATIIVVGQDNQVVGFISRPEHIPNIRIVSR